MLSRSVTKIFAWRGSHLGALLVLRDERLCNLYPYDNPGEGSL